MQGSEKHWNFLVVYSFIHSFIIIHTKIVDVLLFLFVMAVDVISDSFWGEKNSFSTWMKLHRIRAPRNILMVWKNIEIITQNNIFNEALKIGLNSGRDQSTLYI